MRESSGDAPRMMSPAENGVSAPLLATPGRFLTDDSRSPRAPGTRVISSRESRAAPGAGFTRSPSTTITSAASSDCGASSMRSGPRSPASSATVRSR